MKFFYDLIYRFFKAPWDVGARSELVELVESGHIPPSKAVDLGSGTASNAVFLARHGFEVTGIDFSLPAVEKGVKIAVDEGISVSFFQDDLTNLSRNYGVFKLLVDYGTFDDLTMVGRDKYINNVLPMTASGSKFLIYVHEWPLRWWEKWKSYHFGLEPGEIETYFGKHFEITRIAGSQSYDFKSYPPGYSTYLMIRK